MKDGELDVSLKTPPKKKLSSEGYPAYIPLAQVCPWLLRDLSRTWYKNNTFYVKTVFEWNAFTYQIRWTNANRIQHLIIENDLIYCPGADVGKDSSWRSYELLTGLQNLKTLTLYRDDGGPETFTSGGHDEFNSVEWFVQFAKDCPKLEQIRFALYPWSGFTAYELRKSNMVAWIKDWEHEWNNELAKKRKGQKVPISWYLTTPPIPTP
jgi:hypothetical protein